MKEKIDHFLSQITEELKTFNNDFYIQLMHKTETSEPKEIFLWLQNLSETGKLNNKLETLLTDLFYMLR
ncbi:hypothetical protein [Sulfurovum sp.]|uniref:hypothetical protein n=1 Tax=Sulfurovum sp. TaxID=1969726 RepID=UPI003565E66F